MGNWRTVQIVGTCDRADVPGLRAQLERDPDGENFHPLVVNGGLFGLPNWAAERISAVGNLAERNYDVSDVARTIERLAIAAPSLAVKVHCGGDYEAPEVVATITLSGGVATIGPPEIATLPEISEEQIMGQFFIQRQRQQG
jgi:hypothetical protein